ncbi:MAG: type II toxin-antitoxin system PemK/MazF family toxin [Muribaculaceae bacterium]|nr:type II toxin-antitoxin system PemK/MazF family toxin [Muribaculaceae bacterium]
MVEQFKLHVVNLEPTIGAEMRKTRPCLAVSPDEMNRYLKTVMIVPLTSAQRGLPTRILIKATAKSGLNNDSYAAIDQLKTVDKSRLSEAIGEISEAEKHAVSKTLKEMFDY